MGNLLKTISNSFTGLNTSSMQGAGSLGLQNRQRAYEQLPEDEKEDFMRRSNKSILLGGVVLPAVGTHAYYTLGPAATSAEANIINGVANANNVAAGQRAMGTMYTTGAAALPFAPLTDWFQGKYNSMKEEAAKRQKVPKNQLGGNVNKFSQDIYNLSWLYNH